jgi:hypothetical protein
MPDASAAELIDRLLDDISSAWTLGPDNPAALYYALMPFTSLCRLAAQLLRMAPDGLAVRSALAALLNGMPVEAEKRSDLTRLLRALRAPKDKTASKVPDDELYEEDDLDQHKETDCAGLAEDLEELAERLKYLLGKARVREAKQKKERRQRRSEREQTLFEYKGTPYRFPKKQLLLLLYLQAENDAEESEVIRVLYGIQVLEDDDEDWETSELEAGAPVVTNPATIKRLRTRLRVLQSDTNKNLRLQRVPLEIMRPDPGRRLRLEKTFQKSAKN